MKYTVQLIHASGHIDTVEQAIYNPYDSIYIEPLTVKIANAGLVADTVMLRVVGDFTDVPDADSNVKFYRETMLDSLPAFRDTTIAIGIGVGVLPPPDTCFATDGPYPNPSVHSSNDVSVLVHYCGIGLPISAQVYNSLGVPVGSPSTYTSDGQVWDRLPITAPGTAGSYHIQIIVGAYSTTLGYSVY